jgi:hypothetical protein
MFGAREVIVTELDGTMRYFDAECERTDGTFSLRLTLPD